jgi:glycosyltransferase involved in cell wall biosynthesis
MYRPDNKGRGRACQERIDLPKLTISVPAYNDAATIADVARESLKAARQCTDDFEVLLINDGSRDETGQIIEQLCQTTSRVRVIQHPRNLGFGPTIREAYLNPQSDWVVFLPGDGQIPPDQVEVLWRAVDGHDLIVARRKARQDPLNRKVTSWCYNRLVSLVAGQTIHDVNATALISRRQLRRLRLESNTAFVHAELVLKALAAGAKAREVEISHRARLFGSASGNKPGVVWATFKDLVRYSLTRPRTNQVNREASYEV